MTDPGPQKANTDVKRVVFITWAVWVPFHVFGIGVAVLADEFAPLAAALFLDAFAVMIVGLWALAGWLFPDPPSTGDRP